MVGLNNLNNPAKIYLELVLAGCFTQIVGDGTIQGELGNALFSSKSARAVAYVSASSLA